MQILLALLGLAIIASVVLSLTIGKTSKYYLKPLPAIILILLGLGLCMSSALVNVRPDYVGIVKQNGAVEREALNSGWNFVNPLAEVVELNTGLQNDTIFRAPVEAKSVSNDTLIGNTLDGGTIKVGLAVTYVIDPRDASGLYKESGTDYKEKIVQPLSDNILHRNTIAYNAMALKTSSWDDFTARVNDDFKNEFRKHGIVVAKVSIRKLEDNIAPVASPVIVEKETAGKTMGSLPPAPKPIAKKTVAPKKDIASAAVKKSKPLPLASSVVTKKLVTKKVSTVVSKKTVQVPAQHYTAPVDTMYHHKMQEQMASNSTGTLDTSFHANLARQTEQPAQQTIVPPPSTVAEIPTPSESTAPASATSLFVAQGSQPMDSVSFTSMKEFVNMHSTDDKKLEALNSIAKINSFSTAQVLNINSMLATPETKLAFSKLAHPRTIDRENYGLVAGSMSRKSRRSLDKYIVELNAGQADANVTTTASDNMSSNNIVTNTPNNNMVADRNVVPADCQIIDEEAYTMLKRRIVEDNTKDANQDFIKSTVEHNCFTSEQVLRIVKLLKSKKAKLDFAKMAYTRTIDRSNYNLVASNLKSKYRRALDKYIVRLMATAIAEKPQIMPTENAQETVVAANKDHKALDPALLSSIIAFTEAHYSDKAKLDALDKILNDNYFMSAQVADIDKVFESEVAKLEFAEKAYSHTIDKGTYNIVMNTLSSASQKQLEDYIVGLFASK